MQLAGAIYDAPLLGEWRSSLESIDRALGCTRVVLMRHDTMTGRHDPVGSRDPGVEAQYLEQYMPLNDAWPALSRQDVCKAVLDREVLDLHQYERGAFYNEFARPNGMATSSGIVVGRECRTISALVVSHGERTADLEAGDIEMLSMLGPHYRRALLLWRGRALAETDIASWQAVDGLPSGIMIVDYAGTILRTNAAAADFIRSRFRDVLERRQGCGPDVLRSAILAALTRSLTATGGNATRDAFRLQAGGRHYVLTMLPLQGPPAWVGTRRTCFAVFVSDLDRAPVTAAAALTAAFGLTRAEARLAARLGGGEGLACIAASLGIQISTAKTLLARALAKTDTHSQAHLVRLVERLSFVSAECEMGC